jgi:Rrf2 family protein
MNFSKTTEYALRILGYMAKDESVSYTTNTIFEALNIPFRYMRKEMTELTKSGLIESIQGKFGGYRLARKTSEIFLYDIVMATESTFFSTVCFFGYNECALEHACYLHEKWSKVRFEIESILKTTSLSDLIDRPTGQLIDIN